MTRSGGPVLSQTSRIPSVAVSTVPAGNSGDHAPAGAETPSHSPISTHPYPRTKAT